MNTIRTTLAAFALIPILTTSASDLQVPGGYPTIQAALDAATDGDRVVVAPGVYSEDISYRGKDVELVSSAGTQLTIIDVANTSGIEMGPDGALIGFTVRNGKLPSGGAVRVNGDNSYISDNIFEGNLAASRPETESIVVLQGSPVIEGNVFRANNTTGPVPAFIPFGGGIGIYRRSSPLIANNIFHDNQTAAILTFFPIPDSAPVIVNNTMVRNQTGIWLDAVRELPNRAIRNNLIVDGQWGLGIRGTMTGIWQNNNVHGNEQNYYRLDDLTGVDGNISADPLLLNPASNDFRIGLSSPCVDAGTNMSAPSFDFDDNPRPADGDGDGNALTDIGAFEAGSGVGIGLVVEGGLEHECNATGGAVVAVSITTSPEDLELVSLRITVDGQEVADASPAEVFVPLGVSELKAEATTADGTLLEKMVYVSVTDTTAPVIRAWFEDRRSGEVLEKIDSRRMNLVVIRIEADDVCDPDPEVSSVLGTPVRDGQMLRIQGNRAQLSFNTENMTLKVSATDHSGNTSAVTKKLTVEVTRPSAAPDPRSRRHGRN